MEKWSEHSSNFNNFYIIANVFFSFDWRVCWWFHKFNFFPDKTIWQLFICNFVRVIIPLPNLHIMQSYIMPSVISYHHRHKTIHRLLIGPSMPALFRLSSYVASHCLAVAPQSGAKQFFYCTVYYITLNSNCEAKRISKNWKKRRR